MVNERLIRKYRRVSNVLDAVTIDKGHSRFGNVGYSGLGKSEENEERREMKAMNGKVLRRAMYAAALLFVMVGCVDSQVPQGAGKPNADLSKLAGNSSEGERIALELCSTCHVTPVREPDVDIGRPWAEIAADQDMTDQYLRGFLHSPHWPDRQNELSPQQIEDVIAYIRALEPAAS